MLALLKRIARGLPATAAALICFASVGRPAFAGIADPPSMQQAVVHESPVNQGFNGRFRVESEALADGRIVATNRSNLRPEHVFTAGFRFIPVNQDLTVGTRPLLIDPELSRSKTGIGAGGPSARYNLLDPGLEFNSTLLLIWDGRSRPHDIDSGPAVAELRSTPERSPQLDGGAVPYMRPIPLPPAFWSGIGLVGLLALFSLSRRLWKVPFSPRP